MTQQGNANILDDAAAMARADSEGMLGRIAELPGQVSEGWHISRELELPCAAPRSVAILGMGAITKQPVPDEDKGVAFRDTLYLSFSFDHRVIDGAAAGRFFQRVQDGANTLTEEILCGKAV